MHLSIYWKTCQLHNNKYNVFNFPWELPLFTFRSWIMPLSTVTFSEFIRMVFYFLEICILLQEATTVSEQWNQCGHALGCFHIGYDCFVPHLSTTPTPTHPVMCKVRYAVFTLLKVSESSALGLGCRSLTKLQSLLENIKETIFSSLS